MLLWKTFRYSCLHFFIVTMLFSISFLTEPNGGKWMIAFLVLICIISFSVEFAEGRSPAYEVPLFHHVSDRHDTSFVYLLSNAHESFDIKLFCFLLKKSETTNGIAASY
ncbi:hypothetical protein ACQKKC_13225 [Bacillus altitudinis]|uniref:hypothetical protein n=1 Tax=Bacillus altitudinis TaxID=293387 RepID=UPI003D02C54C